MTDYCLQCNPPPTETGPWEGPDHLDMRFGREQGNAWVTLDGAFKMTRAARAGNPGWIQYRVTDEIDPSVPPEQRVGIDCPTCHGNGVIRDTTGDVRIYWGSSYVKRLIRGHQVKEREARSA